MIPSPLDHAQIELHESFWATIYDQNEDRFMDYLAITCFHAIRMIKRLQSRLLLPKDLDKRGTLFSFSSQNNKTPPFNVKDYVNETLDITDFDALKQVSHKIFEQFKQWTIKSEEQDVYSIYADLELIRHLIQQQSHEQIQTLNRDFVKRLNSRVNELIQDPSNRWFLFRKTDHPALTDKERQLLDKLIAL